MEYFGIFAFVFVLILWSRVTRLERLLRENSIRPAGGQTLDGQMKKYIGQTLTVTLYDEGMDTYCETCRVLDTDEVWALLLADEGKKTQRELLIRLDSVRQIELK